MSRYDSPGIPPPFFFAARRAPFPFGAGYHPINQRNEKNPTRMRPGWSPQPASGGPPPTFPPPDLRFSKPGKAAREE